MTGWPWPLDGVQEWFEGLVSSIQGAILPVISDALSAVFTAVRDVSTAIWNALPKWIRDALLFLSELAGQTWSTLWNFVKDPIGTLQAGFDWIVNSVGDALSGISSAIDGVVSDVWAKLPDWIRAPLEFLKDLAGQAWSTLWNFVKDPIGTLQAGFDYVTSTISTAFDGALSTFGSWITDAMAAVAGALGAAVQGAITWLSAEVPKAIGVVAQLAQDYVVDPIVGALQWVFERLADIVRGLIGTLEGLFSHHSPISGEEALQIGIGGLIVTVVAGGLATGLIDALSTKVLATGLDLRALGSFIGQLLNPQMFMGTVVGVLIGVGIQEPLTQYYRRLFKPSVPEIQDATRMFWRGSLTEEQFGDVVARHGFGGSYALGYRQLTESIPGAGDLIRFVVREVIDVEVFYTNMSFQGFSLFWAQAYWEAHWILPSRGDLTDALHRKLISREEYDTYLVLHDFKPEARPDIATSDQAIMSGLTKTLLPRVDIRRGLRIGRLSQAEVFNRYELLGYEEDARLMADIQIGVAYESEINKLRDNAKTDLVNGLIDERTLRADLEAIGLSADVVEYHVTDALADRERKHKLKVLDIYEDAYVKGLKDDDELERDAGRVIVDENALYLYLDAAYIRKYSKPKVTEAS